MSTFNVYTGKRKVREWPVEAIKEVRLEKNSVMQQGLFKLSVTIKSLATHDFYFKVEQNAEKAFYDIKIAVDNEQYVELNLQADLNKHLLHRDDR